MKSSAFKSLVLASVSVMAVCAFTACGGKEATSSASAEQTAATETDSTASDTDKDASSAQTEEGLAFPYEAEEGKLIINSVFPSDIENPDADNQYADGVASIEFVNNSGDYLASVTFTVAMADGSVGTFTATDVPADAKDWVFATDNQTIDLQQTVESISCEAVYGGSENSVLDLVSVDIADLTVNITNNSDQELTNLHVVCHADMGDAYFGGTAYTYTIDYLGMGETASIDASECLLGVAVVDITKE